MHLYTKLENLLSVLLILTWNYRGGIYSGIVILQQWSTKREKKKQLIVTEDPPILALLQ